MKLSAFIYIVGTLSSLYVETFSWQDFDRAKTFWTLPDTHVNIFLIADKIQSVRTNKIRTTTFELFIGDIEEHFNKQVIKVEKEIMTIKKNNFVHLKDHDRVKVTLGESLIFSEQIFGIDLVQLEKINSTRARPSPVSQ